MAPTTKKKTTTTTTSLDAIYRASLDKRGVALSGVQLLAAARRNKLTVSPSQVYAYLRQQAPGTPGLWGRADRPAHTVGVSPARPGLFFIDYGEFHKDWASHNSGATGFLVAAEQFTGRVYVLPTRGKDTQQWLNSIAEFVSRVKQVSVLYSDRDTVAQSPGFRQTVSEKYDIEWRFLKKGHKAFTAERYIGIVKTALSKALAHRESEHPDWSQAKKRRWVDLVASFVTEYNSQKIPGTPYTRQSVSRENFNDFLRHKLGDADFDLRFNSHAAGPFDNESWNRAVFKFSVGDRVRVARAADWTKPKASFAKPSMRGSFGPTVYTISGRQLRTTGLQSNRKYVPVYRLEQLGSLGCHFYEEELQLARS